MLDENVNWFVQKYSVFTTQSHNRIHYYLFSCFALLSWYPRLLIKAHIAALHMSTSIVNSLLFKPPSNHIQYNFPTRILSLNTRTGNSISATHIKRRGATVTILYSHGNAEDLNFCFGWMRRMSRALNVNVFAYDYAGYGGSTGEPLPWNCACNMEWHHWSIYPLFNGFEVMIVSNPLDLRRAQWYECLCWYRSSLPISDRRGWCLSTSIGVIWAVSGIGTVMLSSAQDCERGQLCWRVDSAFPLHVRVSGGG
jgi:hypothetical protein